MYKFDPFIKYRSEDKALTIPNKSTDYCCWTNISLVHMSLSFNIQEILKDETFENLNYASPHTLHEFKRTCEKIKENLKYFDSYFAQFAKD